MQLEEELFYPTVRKPVGSDIMNETDEEHVAKVQKAELDRRNPGKLDKGAAFGVKVSTLTTCRLASGPRR